MLRWFGLAVALVGGGCKQSTDPEVARQAAIATTSNVVVRAELAGRALAELEQQLAIPLERAVTGIARVEAIDTTIRRGVVELVLTVAAGADARPIAREITRRLNEVAPSLPSSTTPPSTALEPLSASVARFTSDTASPSEISTDAPGVYRVRTCGPVHGREVLIDPARLVASGVAIDDVLEVIEARPAALEDARLPGGSRLDVVARLGAGIPSDCRVVVGEASIASVHHADGSEAMIAMMRAGWKVTMGGQVDILLGFDGPPTALTEQVAARIQARPDIEGVVAMEELGPPAVGRIIVRPKLDTDVRAAARAAVAAVPGVRLIGVVDGWAQRAEALVSGSDRQAVQARARAALAALAALEKVDPEASAGCIGCDVRPRLELRLGEATREVLPRVGALLRDGIDVTSRYEAPVRVRIDVGPDPSASSIEALPVRVGPGRTAPLSSLTAIDRVERPAVLLRHDGQPAFMVWMRPGGGYISDAQKALERALPGVAVRVKGPEFW